MRARLLVIVLVVVGLVAVGLGGLLAWTTAQAAQQGFFTRRLTDTVYLASLVQRPVTDAEGADLGALLDRYRQVYGVMVHVVAADGTPFAPAAAPELDDEGRTRLDAALAGRRSESPPLQMPWNDAPLVIAEPVLVDGEVRGAVVTVSPTAALRERELETWGLITAAVLLALGLGVLVSLPVVRWILHPVHRLDEGTGRVAAAVLAGGAAAPVADDSGPPELRRLSASFDRMAETVTGALAAQRAFVADASHQLRNPLTALRLRLSNMRGARRTRRRPTTTSPRWRRPSACRPCSTACWRWPAPSGPRRWPTSTSTRRSGTGSRRGGRWPSTPGCTCAATASAAWPSPRRSGRSRPCWTPCWTTR